MKNVVIAALISIAIGVGLGVRAPAAMAQSYPDRPIRIIVPSPPGGTLDNVARFIAAELQKAVAQPVIVENQPDPMVSGDDSGQAGPGQSADAPRRAGLAAQGNAASLAVKAAPADGYTLLLATNVSHAVNPSTQSALRYNPEKDFVPIAGIMRTPLLLVVRKSFPANNVPELVKLARERGENPPLTYGTDGPSSRVAAELLKATAKIAMTAVPYPSAVPALQDLVASRIDLVFAEPLATAGFVASREVKLLAVTDTARVPLVSDVPTMAEAGFPEVRLVNWAALFAPAGVNAAIVARLNRAIETILGQPPTKESMQRIGATPLPLSPAALRLFLHEDIERWKGLARLARISAK